MRVEQLRLDGLAEPSADDAALEEGGPARWREKRTHSFYRQGRYWYGCLPDMRDDWCERRMTAFDRIVREHAFLSLFFAQAGPMPEGSE